MRYAVLISVLFECLLLDPIAVATPLYQARAADAKEAFSVEFEPCCS